MTQSAVPAVRDALGHVRESAELVFDAMLEPYAALAKADPSAVIGRPVRVPEFARSNAVRQVVDEATRHGKGAWALSQVEERQRQIVEFVADYRKGLYRETPTADWVGRVKQFRDAVRADLNTAMQAPKGWDRVNLLNTDATKAPGFDKDILTSKDVAAELGLAERTVRRKIQEGKLGPWRKQGSRWVITRQEFLHFWADRLLETDSDVPHPPVDDHSPREAAERLDHVKLRPEEG